MEFQFSLALKRLQAFLNDFILLLPNTLIAIIIFFGFYFVAKLIRYAVRRATEKRGRARTAGLAAGRLAQGAIILVGALFALSVIIPGFQPGNVVQILGISSVAIGFAFRDILQNFLAGILLLLMQPFRIGDQIVIGNFEGTVEDIQTRASLIRTYDGRRIIIPNAELFTQKVTVNTAFTKRRLEYDVGIGYGDDIAEARRLILEAINSVEQVLKEPAPDALVMELAPFSVNIRARWWITPPTRADALDSRDQVLAAIKNTLIESGIDLPLPTQQILFHDQTEETDGDRARQREGWPAGKEQVPRARTVAGILDRISGRISKSDET